MASSDLSDPEENPDLLLRVFRMADPHSRALAEAAANPNLPFDQLVDALRDALQGHRVRANLLRPESVEGILANPALDLFALTAPDLAAKLGLVLWIGEAALRIGAHAPALTPRQILSDSRFGGELEEAFRAAGFQDGYRGAARQVLAQARVAFDSGLADQRLGRMVRVLLAEFEERLESEWVAPHDRVGALTSLLPILLREMQTDPDADLELSPSRVDERLTLP